MGTVQLRIEVTLVDGATAEQAAEQLFEALASDEHDLCPLIDTVENYDFREVPS